MLKRMFIVTLLVITAFCVFIFNVMAESIYDVIFHHTLAMYPGRTILSLVITAACLLAAVIIHRNSKKQSPQQEAIKEGKTISKT